MPALRRTSARPSLGPAEDGFTIVEVLIAALVMTIGILGLIGAFDSSRKLTLLSERRTAMAHRAQLEIERLQTYPYGQLAMISAPAHSSETTNPDYNVNLNSPVKCTSTGYGCYAFNSEATTEEEPLVSATKEKECLTTSEGECGIAAVSPTGRKCSEKVGACEWVDGLVTGKVYDFITWHSDANCLKCLLKTNNYKRLTVVVTATVPANNHAPPPLRVSTIVAEPGP
jgi:Tfp pilus assembly protein PilV